MDIKRPTSVGFGGTLANHHPVEGYALHYDSDDTATREELEDWKNNPPTDFFESTPSARDGLARTGVSGVIVLPNLEH